jgi:glycerol-3-phosphate dehydrogenase
MANQPGKLKFGIIGSGSWATAIVKIFCDNGRSTGVYLITINNQKMNRLLFLKALVLEPANP